MTAEEKRAEDSQAAQAAEAELDSVKGLMRLVTNASRVFHSYPPNNELYLSFADQLGEKFAAYLDQYGDLSVAVGQYELLFKNQEVYSETDVSRSLALKLYRDGVRRLRFLPGLEKEEVVAFVHILSQPLPEDSLEDDIVTLMWEQDFAHVKYAVLEEVGASKSQQAPEDASQQSEVGASQAAVAEEAAPAKSAPEAPAPSMPGQAAAQAAKAPTFKGGYKDVRPELPEIAEHIKATVSTLGDESLEELQKQMEEEASRQVGGHVALILFDTAVMEKDLQVTRSSATILGQLQRADIAEGRISQATEVLVKLKKLMSPETGLSLQEREMVKGEIDRLAELEVLHHLAAVANENKPERNQELRQFLLAWGKEGIVPATTLAGMVMDDRTVVDALLEMGKGHADSLVESLQDPNPAAVGVALRVLGELGDASITRELRSAFQHSSAEIKLQAVQALDKLRGQGAMELLELVLDDRDQRVRRSAVRALGHLPGTRSVQRLKQITADKAFANKSVDEKRAAFAALAEAGGEGVIPMLADIVKKKHWFHAARHNETRACAAYALGLVGTPEAAEVLEPFQNSGPQILQSACRTALGHISSDRKESTDNE